ncbi:right-handed parallel beta-helix repeat-containing protein [Chitinophaga sp. 212800010-3]|uniref:right-handed parallel beta-helix repeat-containing protein n=1 Tax=unclassified Chitinophaga TaxID=2619133 RepID=UPI002DEB87CB|nr:Parallel beta helix pectate lyase-like protein [Chitinophaga sp. 212800010-3]
MTRNIISRLFMFLFVLALAFSLGSCTKDARKEPKPAPGGTPTDPTVTNVIKGKEYILVPDANGRLVIDNSNGLYKPGDVLSLKGNFTAVVISNLNGTASAPIIVRNATGTVTNIGNPNWSGGSWATALGFTSCRYVKVGGQTSKNDFLINGSTQTGKEAYFNLGLASHSDNFEISNLTIRNGGTGIWAKTVPLAGDPTTVYPNSYMENLIIHDVSISGTNNEGFYIGHTAIYWNLTTNAPYYGTPAGFTAGQQYVQPIKWRNVKIYNSDVSNIGTTGIQTAAIDGLEIYGNSVTNWGLQHNSGHNGGIMIGGRTTNSNVHDNYVHDGWGELIQFYASGENGGTHIIRNNLLRDNQLDGISLRGTNNAVVQVLNNTVARAGGVSLRVNGYFGMTAPIIANANAFIEPRVATGGTVTLNSYIYTENGGVVTEGTGALANTKFPTVAAAGVNTTNFYQPISGSALANTGYRVQ